MKPVQIILLASGLLSSFSLLAKAEPACQNYDVFVMRHLPKEEHKELPVNKDPDLNSVGKKMAIDLAQQSFMSQIDVSFTTDYRRTKQSIAPSSKQYDFDVYLYDPRNNQLLLERVTKEFCGKNVIIIGHSNTVPAIVTAFGGRFDVTFAGQKLNDDTQVLLSEDDYGAIFHVKKVQGDVSQRLITLAQ